MLVHGVRYLLFVVSSSHAANRDRNIAVPRNNTAPPSLYLFLPLKRVSPYCGYNLFYCWDYCSRHKFFSSCWTCLIITAEAVVAQINPCAGLGPTDTAISLRQSLACTRQEISTALLHKAGWESPIRQHQGLENDKESVGQRKLFDSKRWLPASVLIPNPCITSHAIKFGMNNTWDCLCPFLVPKRGKQVPW